MKVDKKQKRLKAIKLKYVHSPTKCNYCGEEYEEEKNVAILPLRRK